MPQLSLFPDSDKNDSVRPKRSANLIDLAGKTFGRLTVLAFAGSRNSRAAWLCQCVCGNKVVVMGKMLRRGHTRSCGCWRRDCSRQLCQAKDTWTAEMKAELRQRYPTEGYRPFAKKYGLKPCQVSAKAHSMGLKSFTTKRHTIRENRKQIDATIASRYPQEGPVPIANDLGLSVGTVSRLAWELGIRCLTHDSRRSETALANNKSANHAYFDTWAPNMAWLLGYIWTDGSFWIGNGAYRLCFRCKSTDEQLLADIKRELEATAKIAHIATKPAMLNGRMIAASSQVGMRINSKPIVTCLMERHGILLNRAILDLPMPAVPTEFLGHFARGLIDGDGSLCLNKERKSQRIIFLLTRTFSEQLLWKISSVLDVPLNGPYCKTKNGMLWSLAWGARQDVAKLLAWLYPAGTYLALERKRQKAVEILGFLKTFK